jgi:hypothetical protein
MPDVASREGDSSSRRPAEIFSRSAMHFGLAKLRDSRRESPFRKSLVKIFTKSLHPFRGLLKVRTPQPKTIKSRLTLKLVCFQITA